MPQSFLTALICIPAFAAAANYQVGPSRTYTQLTAVQNLLNPGDSVFVDGGNTYASVWFRRSGTAAAPIVIRGLRASGQRPVLSGGVNTVELNGDHYVFEGFDVTGGTSRCIYHHADSVTVRDVVVHDCPNQGILGADQGSGSLLLEFCEVYRCGSGTQNHQIYMSTDEVNNPGSIFRMQYCYVHDANGGNSVKSRSERNEIYYNWIEGGLYHELELIGSDPGGVAPGWTPRLKREDSDVLGNVFRKTNDFSVFRVGGDGTGESHGRYRFVNNTIIAGTGAVFRCFDSLESVEMHNNVFHRPGGGLNLTRTVEALWTSGQAVFAGSNNWITSGALNIPAQWQGTTQGADPGFTNFATQDFRPVTGPLVDGGNASPAGPPGYDFPNPLFPPAFLPPQRALAALAQVRPVRGVLDIGAYEMDAGSPIHSGKNPQSFLFPGEKFRQRGMIGLKSGNHMVTPAGRVFPKS